MKNLLATILILSFATFSFSQSTLSFSKKQQSQYLKHIKNNKTIQTKFKTIPKPIADLLAIKLSQYMAMSKESQLTVATESLKCQNKQGLISTKRSAVYSNFINGKINSSEAKEQLKSLKISSEYDAQLNSIFQEIPDNTTSPPPTSQGKWGKAIGGLIGAIVGGFATIETGPGVIAGAGAGYLVGSNLGDAMGDSISGNEGDGVVARTDGKDCTGFPKN